MNAADLDSFLSDPILIDLIEQVKISDDILDVITLGEAQHSDMLAWCLSPNEGHAQGDAVIKDFLLAAYTQRANATFENKSFFAKWTPGRIRTSSFGAAFVTREFSILEGRLDLFLVDTQNKVIVTIENKTKAKLLRGQLDKYHAAVRKQIAKRSAFKDFDFLFVVLDRKLLDYEDDDLKKLGTKWVFLDYSWLENSANRARLQVERNNQTAQLLVAYCQKQTDWESPSELLLSGLAVNLSMDHERVVKALRNLRKLKLSGWTPRKLLGHEGDLLLFSNQHRQLCNHLLQAQGIAAVLFQIRAGLPSLKLDEHFENGRTWLCFMSPGIAQLTSLWPIYIYVYREVNADETDNAKYTVRLTWCREDFSDEIGDQDALRKHFQSKFPALKNFDGSNVRRIVVERHLDANSAAKAAIKLATDIDELVTSRPM